MNKPKANFMGEYRAVDGVLSADLGDGETALFHRKRQRYITVDETGTWIWNLLKDEFTVAGAARAMIDEFDIDLDEASEAIVDFLERLEQEDFVEKVVN